MFLSIPPVAAALAFVCLLCGNALAQEVGRPEDPDIRAILNRLGTLERRVDELQALANATRYTLQVPSSPDQYMLGFETIVDGESKLTGQSTVEGGSEVILYLRPIVESDKLEVCWLTNRLGFRSVFRGILDNPVAGMSHKSHPGGEIEGGDWLLKSADVKPLRETDPRPVDAELRVNLKPVENGSQNKPLHTEPPTAAG